VKKQTTINQPEDMNTLITQAMHDKLSRLTQTGDTDHSNNSTQPSKTGSMITKVVTKPNPFLSSLTLDVACEQSKHVIVRMFDVNKRIVKMFSWFLVKGINVTTINEVNMLGDGTYHLDMINQEGNLLFSTQIVKGL
jgi:hypothetical protein